MTDSALLSDAVRVRQAGLADAEALLQLHHEGFDSKWSMRQWRWRFVDNPLRRTEIWGAFGADGRCLASFCGVPLACRYAGQLSLANRLGDVAVHPVLRRTIAGSSLLLRVADRFLTTFCGGSVRVGFGFPQPALSRTIVRHCRFEVMSDVPLLIGDAGRVAADSHGLVAHSDDVVPPDAPALLGRWARQVTTGIVRDVGYLRWRYDDNPHWRYRVITVRSPDGTLRGMTVTRPDDQHADAMLAVEWFVPRDDGAATRALLAATANAALQQGRASIVVSFAATTPEFASFQADLGFRVVMSRYQFVYRPRGAGVDRTFMFENWFHSLGDMDFM